jgi:hypothetical protein
MKYKAYLKQKGEGCDYTIGCGQTVINLKTNNLPDAISELENEIIENYSFDETKLQSCELYEINSITIVDVDSIYNKEKLLYMKELEEEKLRAERAEFERLKKKFS